MATADWTMVAGDTAPAFPFRALNNDGTAADLRGATVYFVMAREDAIGTATVDAQATLTDAENGEGHYDWQAGDTDTAGWYLAYLRAEFQGGGVAHYPGDRYWLVLLRSALT